MTWFYLALLAPVLYAAVNLIDDNLLRLVYRSPYLGAMEGGLFGALPLLSLFFLHTSRISFLFACASIFAGYLLSIFYFFYFKAFASGSPSIVIALLNLAPASLIFLSHFILHSNLSVTQVVGFGVVLLASILLTLSTITSEGRGILKVLAPVLISVVLLDAVSLITKYSYEHASFYTVYIYYSTGLGIGGFSFFLMHVYAGLFGEVRKFGTSFKNFLWVFLLGEFLNLAADFCINAATSKGSVALVRVVEGTQPVFVLLIAVIFYPVWPKLFREVNEGSLLKKFGLIFAILVGLILIVKS
jgi:drug/metabolite transporter (DMT)-like permease